MWRSVFLVLFVWNFFPQSISAANVMIGSNPAALAIIVDGVAVTAPQTFSWSTGSLHSLSVASPQQGGVGTRYVFSAWSDGGAQTHSVTVPASDTTYTATFKTQYLLTVTASPPGSGTFSFYPASPDGYYDAFVLAVGASLVSIIPHATAGYIWHIWSGDVGGPLTTFVDPVIQVAMDHPRNVIGGFFQPIQATLNRSSLNFGITYDLSLVTSPQTVTARLSGTSQVHWTTFAVPPNIISASPASGNGNAAFQVSVNGIPSVCNPPVHLCDVELGATSATDAPGGGVVLVNVSVAAIGPSYGSFDTPRDGATNLFGSVPVTGWALDSIEVTKVDIWREPMAGEVVQSNGLVYIADAALVADARPDVEKAYPLAPLNYRAGWGYLLLTNLLPNHGNGTFRLHAIAHNKAGIATDLGIHTITVNNTHATKPFGTIDTPAPNETISGSPYINFGWALTQNPNLIPMDGSTVTVYVDGVPAGHPMYGQFRSDIATLFPSLANSNGAVGFFYIDSTQLSNGVHTIAWSVCDNAAHCDGIGSRYFTVKNGGTPMAVGPSALPPTAPIMRHSLREVEAFHNNGEYVVDVEQMEGIEIEAGAREGYLIVNGERRSLPIGSAMKDGVFYWLAGPEFLGEYELLFEGPNDAALPVRIVIHEKSSPATITR